jgi:hypothetical protein
MDVICLMVSMLFLNIELLSQSSFLPITPLHIDFKTPSILHHL